jgi:hypothetical protein
VPDKGLLGTYKKLQIPQRAEGFDHLFYVTRGAAGDFVVQEWLDEV